jgi:hypothetical protein
VKASTIDAAAAQLLERVCDFLAEHELTRTDGYGQLRKPRPVLDVAGNARFIRNVIEETFDEQMVRIAAALDGGQVDDDTITTINERDMAAALQTILATVAPEEFAPHAILRAAQQARDEVLDAGAASPC